MRFGRTRIASPRAQHLSSRKVVPSDRRGCPALLIAGKTLVPHLWNSIRVWKLGCDRSAVQAILRPAGGRMSNGDLGWITNFIWGIADDVLRDLYVRGKYRDVILPMTVLRRLDAVLEPTKKAVLDAKKNLDKAKIANQDAALRAAAEQGFYNTSKFTLRDLRNRGSQQQLKADFEAYLEGFSPNVQEILDNFEFR